MQLSFRQGIVRSYTASRNKPYFLHVNQRGKIDILVSNTPVVVAFAHGTADYVFEEQVDVTDAWTGPFTPNVPYWLYWDIDIQTGIRSFGFTTVQPVANYKEPTNKTADLHWFDIQQMVMKVFQSGRWVEKIRCFAGKYTGGGVIDHNTLGTQVGVYTPCRAGYILFDTENKPVKKFQRNNRGEFITSETSLYTHSSQLINFNIETIIHESKAVEPIAKFHCVTYSTGHGYNSIKLARSTDLEYPAVGITLNDLNTDEIGRVITYGYVNHPSWEWNYPPHTKLFVGASGNLTVDVPDRFSMQQMGYVVNPTTIFITVGIKYVMLESVGG